MIAYRIRHYGEPDWTELLFEGELEEFASGLLISVLAGCEGLHVQERAEGEWEDYDDS